MTFPGFSRSPALKFFVVGVLTVLMSAPIAVIWAALMERNMRAGEAEMSIAQGWGGAQTFAGPFLAVPYTVIETREQNGRSVASEVRRHALFLPEALSISGEAATQERVRGIFKTTVFSSTLAVEGRFAAPSFARLGIAPERIDWANAVLFATVSDVRGIATNSAIRFDGGTVEAPFAPGLGMTIGSVPGIHAPAPLAAGPRDFAFSFRLSLNGTGRLSFAPVAKETAVTLASDWDHPSFQGAFLPDARDLERPGFQAEWRVPYLRRSLPQETLDPDSAVFQAQASEFGVWFFKPVDFYALVDRALKYAVLFVGLSFLVFFLAETLTGARVHVVQYLLIGAAQVLFYLLLLSIAEHAGFSLAYVAAGGATVALTTAYAVVALRRRLLALVAGAALAALYGLLYLLLQEEDYALLIGSVAAFGVLAATMFVTARVDWYQVAPPPGLAPGSRGQPT